jgi:hypothetical protein
VRAGRDPIGLLDEQTPEEYCESDHCHSYGGDFQLVGADECRQPLTPHGAVWRDLAHGQENNGTTSAETRLKLLMSNRR